MWRSRTPAAMRFLLLVACGALHIATGSTLPNPVQKVIELIQELRSKVIADGKAEELMYNRMACWCETTTKSKAEDVHNCQEILAETSESINTNKGNIASLAADIHDLMMDISTNEAKQYEETTKRERQNADYAQNKAELTNAMEALNKAVQMLEGIDHLALVQGSAKLGMTASQLATVRAVEPAVLKAVARLPTQNQIPAKKLSALAKLGTKFHATYTPFEPTITQILKDLLESFKATAATETKNEEELQTSYEELMQSKASELESKKTMLAEKETSKAKENKDMTASQVLWQATADQLTAANEIFGLAKTACSTKAEQWEERKRLREEELEGIEEGLDILTNDENRALIGKASADGPGKLDFLQLDMDNSESSQPLHKAYAALKNVARMSHNYKVAAIAAKVLQHHTSAQMSKEDPGIENADGSDPEWKKIVIKSIEDIVSDLKDDQKKDTETKDNCEEEVHQLNRVIDKHSHEVKRYNWKLDALNLKVEKIQAKIDAAAQNVEDILEEQEKMLEQRNKENTEYKREQSEDEAAIGVLNQAKAALSKFYEKNDVKLGKLDAMDGKFLQVPSQSEDKANDIFLQERSVSFLRAGKQPVFQKSDKDVIGEMNSHSFSGKGSRGGQSKGIISLITVIVEDLESDMRKATKMEEEEEADYQKLKSETDQEKQDLKDKIDDLKDDRSTEEDNIADTTTSRDAEQEDLDNAEKEMNILMGAGDEGKDISFPCEFMLAKYTERRHRRSAEIDGMMEAIWFLEGGEEPGR